MRNIKLLIEYDGTNYSGWQRQDNARTIQGEIEEVLLKIFQEKVGIAGAGRTDAGVHARGQVANFHTKTDRKNREIEASLNALLPDDIAIRDVSDVPPDFHARHSARERCYSYLITRRPSAILRHYSWRVGYDLDVGRMNKSAAALTGSKEFGSFCTGQSEVGDVRCTVASACWEELDSSLLFRIRSNRFLHGMVRSLVGTMVDVGRGYTTLDDFFAMLAKNDRREAGPAAPPGGLVLESVVY
ncbi:MAG TPA: tRNA pseudouridine(38-40) synthase TruA [Bacteroidota bacterium]|nr:tRNA pseudouridine(38-40) synthase TruA [Bacteroidota bacterium]